MIQDTLRQDGTVLFEGVRLKMTKEGTELEPGDTYVAERNQGPRLLTVRENNRTRGWVMPVENAYPYDTHECVGVEIVDDNPITCSNPECPKAGRCGGECARNF